MKRVLISLASALSLLAASCGPGEPPPCDRELQGNICTLVGNGKNGYSGDEGPAIAAELSLPQDTIVGPEGDVFLLDWNNHRIRKVTPDGVVHHVAGRGELGGTLDDPANSDFNHPTGLLFDATGKKMMIAAWHNSMIRTLDLATGEVGNFAGDGRRAYFGDDGAASTAVFDLPASIAWAPNGDLIVMDQANQVLRAIDVEAKVRLYAGRCVIDAPPPAGPGACAEGVEPVACPAPSGKFTCGNPMETCGLPCTPGYNGDAVPMETLRISQPFGQSADPAGRIVFDKDGNLYFADTGNNLIRRIDKDGLVRIVAGSPPVDGKPQRGHTGDGGPATSALLNNPVDLDFDEAGNLYFTDVYNHCVRRIDPAGTISTVAGQCGTPGTEGDGEQAGKAFLKRPYGLDYHEGSLYISDTGNNRVRVVKL